ncbi:MAG: TrkA family potassium uptake protein [Candidatus Diapherotrites archaeon]|nr:TrkA family potassium uptake protein [Candidatus Diapherotrites archaeon]
MYIIVVGAGTLGFYLVKTLLNEGHDAVAIDLSGDKCKEIANKTGVLAIRGDATEPEVLEKAGVVEADALVAVTGNDETNIIIALVAKSLGLKKSIVRLGRTHYEEDVLAKMGIDMVFYPEATAAEFIEEIITKPSVADLAFLSRGNAEILEIEVKANSPWRNKKISEIKMIEGTGIIAISYDKELVIPKPDTKIKIGDKVLVISRKELVDKVLKNAKVKR